MCLPLTLQKIKYSADLTELFHGLCHQPWAMLLHSSSTSHPDSRFDILTGDPIATFCSQDGVNMIALGANKIENRNECFSELEYWINKLLPPAPASQEWPFYGGAMGHFSYDLARQIEELPNSAKQDLAIPEIAVGLYDWALVVDHKLQKAVLIEPQGSKRWAWLQQQAAQSQMRTQGQKQAQCHAKEEDFSLTSPWQSNMTFAQYQQKFAQIQEYLRAGDCYQINFAQRFHAHYQGDEWQMYKKLAAHNQAPFSAFMRFEHYALLSISPERFLQLSQRKISTKPIKGTRPRSSDPQQDLYQINELKSSEKDRAENLMIVDLLRNDVSKVALPHTVKVPELFTIESFTSVHHLVSTIEATLAPDKSRAHLLQACFPGGSITGAPKVRAMQIIDELEPHRRAAYCGSLGYLCRNGNMDLNIAIRTVVAIDDSLYAWAGGGIVLDSEPLAEYQETFHKLSKILPILADKNDRS
ncbi:MAG: aminodeoxychorismate synthase component I [Enterovibrio sp.]